MANQLGSNPWVLDTAAATVLFQSDIRAAHFEWSEYTGASDKVEVKDRFGKTVWAATAQSDLSLVESFTLEWLHGLALTTLSSGILRVYFK